MSFDPKAVEALFTRRDESYVFARWGRPIVPVIFGVDEKTLALLKGAIEVMVGLAQHKMAETDPELGANVMVFFCQDWAELGDVPHLDKLVPNIGPLMDKLKAANANQYRLFRFDKDGAISGCFVFLRMDEHLASIPADSLAMSQAAQAILLWSDLAFREQSPLAQINGTSVLRPEIAAVIRAAYDPVMPAVARDKSHALRLAARMEPPQ